MLENHVNHGVGRLLYRADDRFVVPYVFWFGSRPRRIVHFIVTAHPTAEWTAQQPGRHFLEQIPRYLPDRTGPRMSSREQSHGNQGSPVGTAILVEAWATWKRVIGTIRRECPTT
jgi:hypothetical protein